MSEYKINSCPPEQPADMPEQPLDFFARSAAAGAGRCRPSGDPPGTAVLRGLIAVSIAVTVAFGVWLLAGWLGQDGLNAVEYMLVVFYALLLLWLAANFWLCVAGALVLIARRFARPAALPHPAPAPEAPVRTAVLMPLYNENAFDAFARLSAMMRSVDAAGGADGFDFFVLSDSTDPCRYREEEWLWFYTRSRHDAHGRLFYRRREKNIARKPGNIAEFCRRWGNGYDYLIVLDADSLMSGETLIECVRRMNADPGLGLLQTWPRPIGGTTIFARAQQFAAAVAGPMTVHGMAALAGRSGNYWGHNAIIRTRAFTQSCGLPRLSGRPPLGGDILSHDFVEAALLVRNGWDVRIDADLDGSYEQAPPNLLESLRRDRRWCQGNLQHLRILPARGLHPISRTNLLVGVMNFVAAPIWLIFVLLAVAVAGTPMTSAGLAQFSADMPRSPAPAGADRLSPLFAGAEGLTLLVLTAMLLLGPKIMGLAAVMLNVQRRRALGGALRTTVGCLLETLLFAALAPMIMLAHSRFVAEVLLGRSVAWTAAQRDASHVTWAEATRPLIWIPLATTAAIALATALVPEIFWWLTPVLFSAWLAIPLTVATGRASAGATLDRVGLFWIAEETRPTRVQQDYASWPQWHDARPPDPYDLFVILQRLERFEQHPVLASVASGPLSELDAQIMRLEAVRRLASDRENAGPGIEDRGARLIPPELRQEFEA
ncbi:MAG: glucans biosynthesis glucosyltransferase MdoH [Dichotomicrobium sp.]